MGAYPDEDAAVRRVDALRREAGRWPGIIRHADGTCDLTWDPAFTPKEVKA